MLYQFNVPSMYWLFVSSVQCGPTTPPRCRRLRWGQKYGEVSFFVCAGPHCLHQKDCMTEIQRRLTLLRSSGRREGVLYSHVYIIHLGCLEQHNGPLYIIRKFILSFAVVFARHSGFPPHPKYSLRCHILPAQPYLRLPHLLNASLLLKLHAVNTQLTRSEARRRSVVGVHFVLCR